MAIIPMYPDIKRGFIEVLQAHRGNVKNACKAVGIGRSTYYEWRYADPEFREACKNITFDTFDYVESKLFEHIDAGDLRAIIFYCSTKMKRQGYGTNVDEDKMVEVIETASKNNQISDAEKAMLDNYLKDRMLYLKNEAKNIDGISEKVEESKS